MPLSDDQQRAYDTVVRHKKSVALLSPAGTGKTEVVKLIARALPSKTTWLTAMTGFAALAIGGRTLHSQAGIGLARRSAADLVAIMKPYKKQMWRSCTTLIIDEISMMSRELFEKLNEIAQILRYNSRPFGGIQLVLVGDFYQLPPVSTEISGPSTQFCFESDLWAAAVPTVISFTKIFRQTDAAFLALLASVRKAELTDDDVAAIHALERPLDTTLGIVPTKLFPTNGQVDSLNTKHLQSLDGETFEYTAEDHTVDPEYQTLLDNNCIAPATLYLRVGAQVILLKNLGDDKHVNGSRGVVMGFHEDSRMPVVRFLSGMTLPMVPSVWEYESRTGEVIASRMQVPLKLAYALSVHKSQGQTIDLLEVDLNGTFAEGQVYVALSRARTAEGLRVLNFHPGQIRTHPLVKATFPV